jgi:Holliday junction resolvase
MTQYAKGYAFEQKVAGDLTQDGYFVIRAGGSHGVADLVALKSGQVLLVQCKTNGVISIGDWNALYGVAERVGAVALVAHRPSRGAVAYRRLDARRVARQAVEYTEWTADEVIVA